ncbi:enoyl-CoA hydratase/isomerase family protein [Microbacterium sp. A82]|uniref:enoyl-CoA hydratase/isomerase family protein n=1 Tax=Microbacterium sp. A82 TaxID=3450452 RepID=UPI003F40EC21
MSELRVDRDGATTVFTIDRIERRNALGREVVAALTAGVMEFQRDVTQRVAIITAAGVDAFCSGFDLKEMADAGSSVAPTLPVSPSPDICGVAACEKPVIAAINGLAVSGGLELALSCDIRLCTPEAWFGAFEVKHGFLAGVAVNVLPRLVPYSVAADMLLAGTRLDAQRALQLGLVQEIVEHHQLLDAALSRAHAIAAHSPSAVWGSKQVLRYWRDAQLAEQQRYYEAVIHRVLLSGDMMEGPRAFTEKRKPQFSDGWPSPLSES